MKEFEVTIRVRNNLLKQRRLELGIESASAFARRLAVSVSAYSRLEAMTLSPLTASGEWRPMALKIAAFHAVSPEELWPEAVLAFGAPEATRRLAAEEIAALGWAERRALPGPREALEERELAAAADEALGQLAARQPRLAAFMRLRFGFDGEPRTLEQAAREMGVSRSRAGQLEASGIRQLRRKALARRLCVIAAGG